VITILADAAQATSWPQVAEDFLGMIFVMFILWLIFARRR
jgi:hypothetical protein